MIPRLTPTEKAKLIAETREGKRTYSHHGKQVLMNGFHFADAITEEAARRIAEALNGWLPIKTAPKDGRYIIAARFDRDELKWVKHSRWMTTGEAAENYGGEPEDYRPGWTDGEDEEEVCAPTHWQTLEPPPIPADASTPSAGARSATRSVPGVGGGL